MDPLLAILLSVLLLTLALPYIMQTRRRVPPGPRGLPLIGALLDHPTKQPWLAYMNWGRNYGSDIVSYTVMGQRIIVLNSATAANELLERRSAIYSDRHRINMIHLVGWNRNAATIEYGDLWRQHRRIFQQYFNPSVTPRYRASISRESQKMLQHLSEHSDQFMHYIQHLACSVIMDITYGINIKPQDDPYTIAAETALESFAAIGNAGSYMVEFIPWLRYLPKWFPGGQFKRDVEMWRKDVDLMFERPFMMVKNGMVDVPESISASLLSKLDDSQDNKEIERIICYVAGTAFAGGFDTSVSQLWSFVLAMLLFPKVQAKAQAEIDRVIGSGRLPQLEDRESLPYITAIMRETFRWRPVAPLAAPHKVLVADEYRGYYIPAGTIVIGNVWAILHDEKTFPDPEIFDPRRHLSADGWLSNIDTSETVFGFGRRICPGRHFATDTVWLAIAQILAVFNVCKVTGKDGKPIEPSGAFTTGILVRPTPFPASFKPRSEAARILIGRPPSSE